MTRPGAPGGSLPAAKPAIALATGRGTGPELAAVFERVLDTLTAAHPNTVWTSLTFVHAASTTRTPPSPRKGATSTGSAS